MKKLFLFTCLSGLVLMLGCNPEESFELGNSPSAGSLQSDVNGDCLPKTVNGTYEVGVPLIPTTNTITVDVNVTQTGTYTISSDTVNGFYFRATGLFTTLGVTTITLRGNGTPFAAGVQNFRISYSGTICDVQVTTLPAGAGVPAVFTLEGAPGACTGATVAGTYATGVALNPGTNTATISVNVTSIGTYNISTTFQGMTFAKAGAFINTGVQTVTLEGTGIPTTGGVNTVPVTVGTSTCSFDVNVGTAGAGTLGGAPGACTAATVNGTYTLGTALTAANTVQIQVNMTSAGTVSISTDNVAGMIFSFNGNLAAGVQNVTLAGAGTPTASGAQNFTVTFGTSTCTFSVTVAGAPPGAGTLGGAPNACTSATVNGTYTVNTALTGSNTVQVQVNVTTAGLVNISTNTVAGISFSFSGNLAVGTQNVTLAGTGTPTASGVQNFTVTFGTSTCTFTVNCQPALSNDYHPRTVGSNWSYEIDGDGNDSLYRYVIAATHSALGNTYNIFMYNDGTGPDSSGYYRKSGTDHFEWFDVGAYLGYDNSLWAEYTLLKEAETVGTPWFSSSFNGTVTQAPNPPVPLQVRFRYAILQKDVPVSFTTSLGTMNFTNVIIVEEKFQVFDGTNWIDATPQVGYGKAYYARGIGLIKYEFFDGANNLDFEQELRRYQVL